MRKESVFCAAILVLLVPPAASAAITFTQLDDDVFVVSHRVKVVGSRGKAMRMVHVKTSSLCIAAGYTHYQILEQESGAAQHDESANASVRVRFFEQDAEGRIGCERNADAKYVRQARLKLDRRGYRPPSGGPESGPA